MPTPFVAYLNFGYCLPNSFQFAIKLNINLILNGTSIRTRSGYSDKIYRVVETVRPVIKPKKFIQQFLS